MRSERTPSERLSDNVLLLHLWAKAQRQINKPTLGGRLKLMKLAFLAAYPLYLDGTKAFDLQFYRWHHGPMANQVDEVWDELYAFELLIEREEFSVTEEGFRLADSFEAEVLALEENRDIAATCDEVVARYGSMDTSQLLEHVYGMHCYSVGSPGKRHSIRSMALGTEITKLIEEGDAEKILHLPPGWQLTLELTFHPNALRHLRSGIEDSRAGRVYGWKAMWTDV